MDKKISQLNNASALQGPEKFAVVQNGETKQASYSDIIDYMHETNIVLTAGTTIDLNDSEYDDTRLIKLTWANGVGNMTMYLPDATATKNNARTIRFISDSTFTNASHHVDLTPTGGQTLDGETNPYVINKAYEGIMVWSDGAEWFIIQKKAG